MPDAKAQMIGPSDFFSANGSIEERAWQLYYKQYAGQYKCTPDFITLLKFWLTEEAKLEKKA